MNRIKIILMFLTVISFPFFVHYLRGLMITSDKLNNLHHYKLKKIKIVDHESISATEGGEFVIVDGFIDTAFHENIVYGVDEREFLDNLPKDSIMELWVNEIQPDMIWAKNDHVLSKEHLEETFKYRLVMAFIFIFLLISFFILYFYPFKR